MKNAVAIFTVCLFLGLSAPIYAQVLNPANGHYYQLVESETDWYSARDAATGMSYSGATGHLATITSEEEEDFVVGVWPCIGTDDPTSDDGCGDESHVWFGGTDAAIEGTWQWITGESWAYDDWADGEPNDDNDNEDCIVYREDDYGYWNDENCNDSRWYLVEFEPEPNFPKSVPTFNRYHLTVLVLLMLSVGLFGFRRTE